MKLGLLIISIVLIVMISTANALPELLDAFNAKYNTKGTRLDSCDLCHIPGKPLRSDCDEICHSPGKPQKIDPINLNPYGESLKDNLSLPVDKAFTKIETIDSAGDGVSNIKKIHNRTFPGNKTDILKGNKKNLNNKNFLSELLNLFNFQ